MKELNLGLNFYAGHDTGVFSIFKDDVYGLSQEKLTRFKHDNIFPIDAIKEMIRYKNIDPLKVELIYVGVATKELESIKFNKNIYKMSNLLRDIFKKIEKNLYIKEFTKLKQNSKSSLISLNGIKYILLKLFSPKTSLKKLIQQHLKELFPNASLDITFYEHHLCHAYSSFFSSTFEHGVAFTFDGYGDGYFSKIYSVDRDKKFQLIGSSKNIFIQNAKKYSCSDNGKLSVGNIYSIFTYLLGFTPLADEGKVEALAAFGNHNNSLYTALSSSYYIDKNNLSINLLKNKLEDIFEEENIQNTLTNLSKAEISASVQKYLEDVTIELLTALKEQVGDTNITLSGGVTANVILNMNIYNNLFENIFIAPAMGDDGLAQGASLLKANIDKDFRFPIMPYFGSSYSKNKILKELKNSNLKYEYLEEKAYLKAAKLIVESKIGAIFQNRCEFGPRSLGNRSIIANVQDKNIQKFINKSIKNRPLFQPFCPSIMIEEKDRLFEKAYNNKHMTIAFKLKPEYKDKIPGTIHIDDTARVQFVSKEDNPNYYSLIKEVKRLTGFGVIINTSFNKHGRTIVLTPSHAITDFLDTNLDFMVMDGFFITREENGF